ncbi:hypothetical protein BGX26_001234 [Mortierella sp. AD094]|nr:hypothetical protein BGX26_001234 [Mortierella sp. AD094]
MSNVNEHTMKLRIKAASPAEELSKDAEKVARQARQKTLAKREKDLDAISSAGGSGGVQESGENGQNEYDQNEDNWKEDS